MKEIPYGKRVATRRPPRDAPRRGYPVTARRAAYTLAKASHDRRAATGLTLVMVAGLAAFGVWAIVTNIETDTLEVTSYAETTEWSTYQESHTVYYECGNDTCSYTYYTTEWRFYVHHTFGTSDSTFPSVTKIDSYDIGGYPLAQPEPAHPHYDNTKHVNVMHWRGTNAVISVDPVD